MSQGAWKTASGTFGTPGTTPAQPGGVAVEVDIAGGTIAGSWSAAARATSYRAEIYVEAVHGSGTYDTLKLTQATAALSVQWATAAIAAAGGPWDRLQLKVLAVNGFGDSAAGTATFTGGDLGEAAPGIQTTQIDFVEDLSIRGRVGLDAEDLTFWSSDDGSTFIKSFHIDRTNGKLVFDEAPDGIVTSVAGKDGDVTLVVADITDAGTMALQDANAVAITGGTASLSGLTLLDSIDGALSVGYLNNFSGTNARMEFDLTANGVVLQLLANGMGAAYIGTTSAHTTVFRAGGVNAFQISSAGVPRFLAAVTMDVDLAVTEGGTGASDAAGARANLGLGSIATQAANNVTITGGSITGITDLAIADGGTGASDASTARSNLGLGTIATQAASNVAITGGAIDGAAIGATTASTGRFTTVNSTSSTYQLNGANALVASGGGHAVRDPGNTNAILLTTTLNSYQNTAHNFRQQGGGGTLWAEIVSTGLRLTATELRIGGDVGGQASHNTFTGVSNLTANSTGVGTIKLKGATNRDSSGFLKVYVGTTAYYVPVFSAITG